MSKFQACPSCHVVFDTDAVPDHDVPDKRDVSAKDCPHCHRVIRSDELPGAFEPGA